MNYIYINGDFYPENEAKISIQDRGFKHGDGVFETISFYNKKLYQWNLHLSRLSEGLKAIKIQHDIRDIESKLLSLIERNNIENGLVRIAITRGIGGAGYLPSSDNKPSIIIETLAPPIIEKPIDLWLSSYQKTSAKALPVHAKTMQGLSSTLARIEANEHDCAEALLLGSDQQICETSSGNIFWIKGKNLYTPALKSGILGGTIRDITLKLSPLKNHEDVFNIERLYDADEVFITSVAWKILPVANIFPYAKNYKSSTKTNELLKLLNDDIKEKTA